MALSSPATAALGRTQTVGRSTAGQSSEPPTDPELVTPAHTHQNAGAPLASPDAFEAPSPGEQPPGHPTAPALALPADPPATSPAVSPTDGLER